MSGVSVSRAIPRTYISFVHVVIPGTVIDGLDEWNVQEIDRFMLSLGMLRAVFAEAGFL